MNLKIQLNSRQVNFLFQERDNFKVNIAIRGCSEIHTMEKDLDEIEVETPIGKDENDIDTSNAKSINQANSKTGVRSKQNVIRETVNLSQ